MTSSPMCPWFLIAALVLATDPSSVQAQELTVEAPSEASTPSERVGPDRYQLGFAGGARFRTSFSYGLFTDDSGVGVIGLAFAYDVVTIERFRLAGELVWAHEELQSPSYQAIAAELVTDDIEVGLRGHYALHPWIGPHARVAGGWTRGRFSLAEPGRAEMTGTMHAPYASLGGGFTVRTPAGLMPHVSLGVALEAGYRFAAPLPVQARARLPVANDDTPIATTSVDLGDLDRSAAYLRVDLFVRY